jgi:beta-propeller repeat-containing protein
MRKPATLGLGIAMLLAMLSLPPTRALGTEGSAPGTVVNTPLPVTGQTTVSGPLTIGNTPTLDAEQGGRWNDLPGAPSVNIGDGNATATPSAHATPSASTVSKTYGKLPMTFEKNAGQSRSGVDFIARGSGYSVFLTPGEAVLAVKKQGPPARTHDPIAGPAEDGAIRMSLVGSSSARAAGESELSGKVNYFIGSDPAKWKTGIPTFARVRYSGVYPGIDVVYYGNQRQLEHDFIVSPGADSGAITLAFTGASADIGKDGDLVLAVTGGQLSMHRPHIYQEIDGVKRAVSGGYVKRPDGRIGFAVGPYDMARPLVIDPVLVYGTYLGGSNDDAGTGIAVDLSGNAYVVGHTASSDFPTEGPRQPANGGGYDAFVAKINASGSALVYSTYLGGSAEDRGLGIAVDALGQAYVTGHTASSNFPTTPGAYQTTYGGGVADAFVAKLSASGSTLVYSTYLGGSGYDVGAGIAVDPSGNAYVTGYNYLADFPTTTGAFQTASAGAYDAFLTKLNPSGSGLVYSTYVGGNGDDFAVGIAVDGAGNAYVTGSTNWSNFPTTPNARQGTFGGDYDAFVTKLNPTGSALVYSTYLGGPGREFGQGIAIDTLGNAYVVGQTTSGDFPTTLGAYQTAFGGSVDAFVAKINSNGSGLVYSTYLGGSGWDNGTAIAVDLSGNAYVTGVNYLGGFPTKDPLQATYVDGFEAFVAELNSTGSGLVYSTYLGGNGNDLGLGIAVDPLGNAYVVGTTQSTDFPTSPNAYQDANAGIYDAFVAKIGAPTIGKVTGGGSVDVAGGIGTFGFMVQRQAADASIRGNLEYVSHASGVTLHSVLFTWFHIDDMRATFGGTCTSGGAPCTFTVEVMDNGEAGVADTFTISVSGGPTEGGTLRSGNIQIH